MSAPAVSAIIPTLGRSPCLDACMGALRRVKRATPEVGLEILVVDQTEEGLPAALRAGVDRVLRPRRRPLGFAAANNLAWTEARGSFIALINDDAVVADDWFERLLPCFDDDRIAAVQGTNVVRDAPDRIDGRGIVWNRWWQAVQIDRDAPVTADASETPEAGEGVVRDIFGVSATAAIFRRQAVDDVCAQDGYGQPFDTRLESYYEDVDLAIRLRSAGCRAACDPRAIVQHVGSATGSSLSHGARPWIHGNRILVLARLLGRGFALRLPRILLRDGLDLWHARQHDASGAAWGILLGWRRAARWLPHYLRAGSALVDGATLRAFTVTRSGTP